MAKSIKENDPRSWYSPTSLYDKAISLYCQLWALTWYPVEGSAGCPLATFLLIQFKPLFLFEESVSG